MWQPPTDNLYKFMAIAGLVLFALGLYVPLLKLDDYNLQVVRWDASYLPLLTRLEQSSREGLDRLQCSIDTAEGKSVHPGRAKQCAELEALRPRRVEESKALAVAHAELSSQQPVLAYLRQQVWVYQVGGILVAAVGAAVALNGFRLWYTRVQKFLDAEAIAKAKSAAERRPASRAEDG